MAATDQLTDLILRRLDTLEEGHRVIQANQRETLESVRGVEAQLRLVNGRVGKTETAVSEMRTDVDDLQKTERARAVAEAEARGYAKARGDMLVSKKGAAAVIGLLGAIPTLITTVSLIVAFKGF